MLVAKHLTLSNSLFPLGQLWTKHHPSHYNDLPDRGDISAPPPGQPLCHGLARLSAKWVLVQLPPTAWAFHHLGSRIWAQNIGTYFHAPWEALSREGESVESSQHWRALEGCRALGLGGMEEMWQRERTGDLPRPLLRTQQRQVQYLSWANHTRRVTTTPSPVSLPVIVSPLRTTVQLCVSFCLLRDVMQMELNTVHLWYLTSLAQPCACEIFIVHICTQFILMIV